MKVQKYRNLWCFGLVTVVGVSGPVSTFAGACAVSDGSILPTDDGCKLAYVFNQQGDDRLVVIDEQKRRRYEAPLERARMAPFWEGGKVYVVALSGNVQEFSISGDKLVAGKVETICPEVVRTAEYSRSQQRLYLIRTGWDKKKGAFSYELWAIDFPARKTLWKKICDPGSLTVMGGYVCVTGLKQIEAFNSDTGKRISAGEARKAVPDADEDK